MKRNRRNIPAEPETENRETPDSIDPMVQPTHPVLAAVAEHLASHKLAHGVMSHGQGIMFSMCNKTFTWPTVVRVLDDRKMLRFAARLPLFVPPNRRRDVAALISRLNYGTLLGAWQMDPSDGEVTYAVTHLFGEAIPDQDTIHTLSRLTCAMAGEEGPQILKLIRKSSGGRLQLPPPGSN